MRTYTVIVLPIYDNTSVGAFQGLYQIDPDAVVEFVGYDGLEEVYTIETDKNVDNFLNLAPAVVTYTVTAE